MYSSLATEPKPEHELDIVLDMKMVLCVDYRFCFGFENLVYFYIYIEIRPVRCAEGDEWLTSKVRASVCFSDRLFVNGKVQI